MHSRFCKPLFLGLSFIPNSAFASVTPANVSVDTILVLAIFIIISLTIYFIRQFKPRNHAIVKLKRYLGALESMSHRLQPLAQNAQENTTQETLHWLLKEVAKTIDSAQVSLWFFNNEKNNLTQCHCFESQHDTPARPPIQIALDQYPTLFAALQREKTLSIPDVENDLCVNELDKFYTKNDRPLSILMAHIHYGQKTHGILQIHTRRRHRQWDDSDRRFANAVADLLSLYLSTTEVQKAQESLTDNESKLRDLVDASADWYWETDQNHCFSYFSEQFSQLTGIDEKQLIGKTRLDLKPHALQTTKWKQHLDDLNNHRAFRNFQYTTRIGDREISVTSNGKPFFDKNGEFAGYRGTGSDHTESTIFKARFEEGLNALPNGFLMWDSQDRLVMWNNTIFDMFPALTPYASKKPTFLKLMQICHRENVIKYPRPFTKTYAKAIVHAHQTCGINEVELTNGRHLLVHEHKTSEGGIVGIYTDITALKEREKEILEAKKISETLSSCSNILFHARNESFILSEICRIITETFPFETAWISLFNTTGQLPEFLKVNMLRGRQLPQTSYRPSSTLKQAFIKQEYMILNENLLMQAYPDFQSFFQNAGLRTGGLFPIWIDTKVTGFLTVVSSDSETFNSRYINLMSELANDVGYGLTSLRSEHSRLIAEEALRESESRYRSLVDMSPDAILVLDEQHKIVFSNPEGHVLFATTNRAEIYHKSFYDFLVKQQDLFANAPRITDDDPTQFIGSVTLRRMDERLFEADITARPVSYAGLTTRLLIIRDVTERNRVNEHLAQTSKLATLGEMAAGITHELSQPLNIMRFAAEGSLLKMQRGKLEKDESQKKFDLISMQCGRMADIIDHMRIFSRKDTGDQELFDPTLVVRQSVDLIESQFLAEGIHLDVRYPTHYAMLNGRPIQLEQVILNLVNNARDAINQRHKTTNWEEDENKQIILQITYDQADHKINIAITDNGGGIPEDALAKLFDPFFTTKEVGKGTGLGLSVSYGIIAAMGGAIRARNIHKGARFDITLPCAIEEEKDFSPNSFGPKTVNKKILPPSIDLDEDEDDDLDMNADGAKVLVVDDEIYAAEAMMEYLFDQGYQVNIAGDGEEALELYDMEAVDVVVTDMRMPRMDGYVLIQNLKKRSPSLPVIVVTGHTGMDDADQHDLNTLAFKILKKPVSLSYLSESIEEALQSVTEKTFSTIED